MHICTRVFVLTKLFQSFTVKKNTAKLSEAYFSVSHQRKTVQMTPYRNETVWNIYRFCQKFVLGMGSSLQTKSPGKTQGTD